MFSEAFHNLYNNSNKNHFLFYWILKLNLGKRIKLSPNFVTRPLFGTQVNRRESILPPILRACIQVIPNGSYMPVQRLQASSADQ